MTKSELIKAVAAKADVTKKDAEIVVNAVFDVITDSLKDGEKVSMVGFGTFEIRERAARKGLNPRTVETIEIAAAKLPTFKAGKALKDAVAGK